MSVAFASAPILAWEAGELIDVGNGMVALGWGAEKVLSVQPNGSYQTRPRSAIGAWETGKKVGDKVVYGGTGKYYVVPLIEGL